MGYWVKLEVYNEDTFIGSFYEDGLDTKKKIKDAIDAEYGVGNWTRYNIGN